MSEYPTPCIEAILARDELQRIRKDLHNILWGGGKYRNELFFNLVGLFLVKLGLDPLPWTRAS